MTQDEFLKLSFDAAVSLAESLSEESSNGGGTRGYDLSVWYGDEAKSFVVDYDSDGDAARVQLVGQANCLHRGE